MSAPKLKWKRGNYEIEMYPDVAMGKCVNRVGGFICENGFFGIAPGIDGGWALTHLGSGRRLCPVPRTDWLTFKQARKFAEAISPLTNWSKVKESCPMKLRKRLHALADQIYKPENDWRMPLP